MTFSEKLQLLRKQKGLSQEALAEMLAVSRQSVSKWEAQQAFPDISKVIALGEIFDISIDQLLKDEFSITKTTCFELSAEHAAEVVETPVVAEEPGTMFCTRCGKENCADSQFCGYCGHPFTELVVEQAETDQITKADIDLAYYKANFQIQQKALQLQQQELVEVQRQTKQQKKQLHLQRKQYNSMMKCPRCGSTSLSGNKKGYGIGKGLVGAAIAGPFGLVAGNLGSKKVIVTCMKCGYRFKAGRKF